MSNPERGLPADPDPSLQWSTENGWVVYNSLQLLAHIIAVFIAPRWRSSRVEHVAGDVNAVQADQLKLSIQTARSLHFLVLVSFLLFTVVHVSLMFTTGLVRNLNHIYAGRNDDSWVSLWIFRPQEGAGCQDHRWGGVAQP